jgi:hypothetical protein
VGDEYDSSAFLVPSPLTRANSGSRPTPTQATWWRCGGSSRDRPPAVHTALTNALRSAVKTLVK